ncbi:MAG: hypothetical protein U1E67_08105 [Hyphomicrobiales bacterium]
MTTPLQTQYTVLNERRLHFGRMFWQNIAFHIIGVLLVFYLLIQMKVDRPALVVALVVIGLATLLMSFIAHRLQRLEVIYENHLAAIETTWLAAGEAGIQRPPVSGRFSSRLIVIWALALVGLIFILLGLAGAPFSLFG